MTRQPRRAGEIVCGLNHDRSLSSEESGPSISPTLMQLRQEKEKREKREDGGPKHTSAEYLAVYVRS